MDAETRVMLESIQAQIATLGAELRAEMRAGDETTRRHFDVVAESLRGDIRTGAEGVAGNTELTLRLHHELKSEMDGRFRSLETVLRVTFADLRREIDGLRSDN